MTERKTAANEAQTSNFEVLKQRAAELAAVHGIATPREVALCLGVSEETAAQLLRALRGDA